MWSSLNLGIHLGGAKRIVRFWGGGGKGKVPPPKTSFGGLKNGIRRVCARLL